MIVDIVIWTYNRPEYFNRTLSALIERTRSPYRLHFIDDGSTEQYLPHNVADSILTRRQNAGAFANLMALKGITQSEIIVTVDDDVLVPDVKPDWLARGLEIIKDPGFGMFSLNDASTKQRNSRHVIERGDLVTTCGRLDGPIMFIKRHLLFDCPKHLMEGQQTPAKQLSVFACRQGLKVGFLTSTYSWHFGTWSARTNEDISHIILPEPVDLKTFSDTARE
jgi:glycosyltransferase involved in cell wall biosynthesis